MANYLPGTGKSRFVVQEHSSMHRDALGKLTSSNHLSQLYKDRPAEYDRKIITLFAQTALYSNDFLNLLNASDTFFIGGNTETVEYAIDVKTELPKIVENLAVGIAKPGAGGGTIELVFDKKEFVKGDRLTANRRQMDVQLYVTKDPIPSGKNWRYTFTAIGGQTASSFVNPQFLRVGTEYMKLDNITGENTVDLSGLSSTASKLKLVFTLCEGFGVEHTVTESANFREVTKPNGEKYTLRLTERNNMVQDLTMIAKRNVGQDGREITVDVRWAKTVDVLMQKEMLDMRVKKLIWGRSGSVKDENNNLIPVGAGLYQQMKEGNYHTFNRGEFSLNIIRRRLSDLYYNRVPMADRKTLIWTNEAGLELVNNELRKEAGKITWTTLRTETGAGVIKNVEGGMHGYPAMGIGYTFNEFMTTDAGLVQFKHMPALDDPITNSEYGENQKAPAVFMIFDISNSTTGMPTGVRLVRSKGMPSMTWGYINGTSHYLGHAASQGMESANMMPGYKAWMKDRVGVFLEDPTRCMIIEEIPAFGF